MRYIIYGAGAIGGIVGSKLHLAGHDVILIARGDHLRVLKERGLTVKAPGESILLHIAAVSHPSEIDFRPGDVVILTMKSQDTEKALDDLRAVAGDRLPIICCQNGIENERVALRRFADVYGMMILMPATFLEAGIVETPSCPVASVGDLGRFGKSLVRFVPTDAQCQQAEGSPAKADQDQSRVQFDPLPAIEPALLPGVFLIVHGATSAERLRESRIRL